MRTFFDALISCDACKHTVGEHSDRCRASACGCEFTRNDVIECNVAASIREYRDQFRYEPNVPRYE